MKIEVGKTYWNGFGCKITIVAAPTAKCRWYEDHIGYHYHETGEMVRMGGNTENNLVCLVTEPVEDTLRAGAERFLDAMAK